MDYKPKYKQPFQFSEILLLDIPTLAQGELLNLCLLKSQRTNQNLISEVAKVELSIHHLKRTQDELRAYIQSDDSESPDRELETALEENDVAIAAQEERVSMLRLALQSKGVNLPRSSHALSDSQEQASETLPSQISALNNDDAPNEQGQSTQDETVVRDDADSAEGVFL
ncbi:hypothetical protein SCHPADRAFT_134227 [Schizopora paradoxa]|uniref:Uncharacterized protein n=1 Tax=Schizopora paradoxa TaxID=27342 RepID=A0A0H2S119_9AGAM|nr:hypothetical protein SCHPADRAFT_134227 [Schizopora paradoxa]